MSAEDFAVLLENPDVRHYFVMYVHSRSDKAERELLAYLDHSHDGEEREERIAAQRHFLVRIHSEYFVPMLETKLFGKV